MSWSIPEWDNHLIKRIKNGVYQKNQRDYALSYVNDWDIVMSTYTKCYELKIQKHN